MGKPSGGFHVLWQIEVCISLGSDCHDAVEIQIYGWLVDPIKMLQVSEGEQPVVAEAIGLIVSELCGCADRRCVDSSPSQANAAKVQFLIRSISHEYARLVASNPETLDHLEWRDLERMIAGVMEGLGFQTTRTPPSKDARSPGKPTAEHTRYVEQ